MLNSIKRQIYSLVVKLPFQRGKVRLSQALKRVIGRARFDINGVVLELDSTGYIDGLLISGTGHDTIVEDLVKTELADGGVFLDVGANIGYFSVMAAKLPNVHVFSFEPSPRELSRLYTNINLNILEGSITVFPFGLAEQESVVPFHLSEVWNPGMNSALAINDQIRCLQTIERLFMPLETLLTNDVCSRVRLCKIDVEGYELCVLRGMDKRMDSMKNVKFVVEITPDFLARIGQHPCEIYEFFEGHGFTPRYGLQAIKQYDEVFSKA